jgi:hypothetical protein
MKHYKRSTNSRGAIERDKVVGCREENEEYSVRGRKTLRH